MSIYDNLQINPVNPEILQVEKEINEERIYERYFPLEEGDVVVDIGAHVGVFTARAAKVAAMVYALEPDPQFYKELKKKTAKNVVAIPQAISSHTGTSTILSDGHANTVGSGDVEIYTSTFKDFIKAGIDNIDFLKVDCEGGEYDIFTKENMKWIAKNCRKIAGELHIHNDTHRKSVVAMFELFDKYGIEFRITSIDGVWLLRESFMSHLDYFTEVLFYALTPVADRKFETPKVVVNCHFVGGCFAEIAADPSQKFMVQMFAEEELVHEAIINGGCWTKAYRQYYTPWRIQITNLLTHDLVYEHQFNLTEKRVFIELGSSALGDTIAWFPYIAAFKEQHGCHVLAMTYHNELFKANYPEIEFVEPGSVAQDIYAWYNIGWHYTEEGTVDLQRNPTDFKSRPMQQTASDILGLPYMERCPDIVYKKRKRPISKKYVCIAVHATSQAKYWNHPTGWQEVVNYLALNDYVVVLLSREEDGFNGNRNPEGVVKPKNYQMETILNYLYHTDLFIGIGSGLTWLSWAMRKPTIMISGFSEGYTEMHRVKRFVAAPGKCSGCFNRIRLQNDGDWNWCPDHKGTSRQFECSRSIKPSDVIETIERFIGDEPGYQ